MDDTLERFRSAQADRATGFAAALSELRAGRKRSHWIWYIFPQLVGLGASPMAVAYGVRGVDEAAAYLRDPVLRDRLTVAAAAVAAHFAPGRETSLRDLMGSEIDARKLVSSMTLFSAIARRLQAAGAAASDQETGSLEDFVADAGIILAAAARQGLPPCAFTQRFLERVV